jgi:DMSO/TMAO reductase YedYZ molybdopterin-dependent catalytic subunit
MKTETRPRSAMPESGIGSPWNLGVTAALWMTALMFAHRLLFGIASVPGLITERVIPLVPGQASGDILGRVGQFAKLIPELSAIVAQLIVGGLVGAWYARAWGKADAPAWKRWAFGPLVGTGLWLATLAALWPVLGENYHGRPPGTGRALTIGTILVDYLLFGVLLPLLFLLARRAETGDEAPVGARPGLSRRQALSVIGGGALLATAGFAFGLQRISTLGYDGKRPKRPVQAITDNASFYSVTKNLADPHISNLGAWRLEIGGDVANPMTLTYDDLKALPAVDETATLLCIGNVLGAGLSSTAVWHGAPLMALIDKARPKSGVTEVLFTASDGYTNTIDLAQVAAEGVIVAYGMNGEPLPRKHGYPARIITPGRYGEKHVKWVTRITVQRGHTRGFYESQGWDRDAVVKTTARIDAPAKADTVPLGQPYTMRGLAYGGLRGVSTVEVTTDGGATWQPAAITANPSPQSWSLWEYAWTPAKAGSVKLGVRCYERDGTLQPTNEEENFPSGSAGIHFVDVMVR